MYIPRGFVSEVWVAMEKRSLIRFGKNSYVVSLPKDWVRANKLAKGSAVYLELKPASITLTAERSIQHERKARIPCEGTSIAAIETELIACYKAGFTTIILEGSDVQHHAAEIKRLLQNLFGMEVIEHTLTRIVIKDLVDIQQLTLPTLVRRMDLMIRSMLDDALEGSTPATIAERDNEVNRLEYLLARVVRRVLDNPTLGNLLDLSIVEAYHMNRVAWTLERLGDYIKYISASLARPRVRNCARRLLEQLRRRYIAVMNIYYGADAERAVAQHAALKEEIIALNARCDPLVLENVKNALRDLRVILRATIEASHPEA